MAEMKLRNPRTCSSDLDLCHQDAAQERRCAFLPSTGAPAAQGQTRPRRANAVAYYPGCSLHSTATEFNHSAKAVCEALDLDLIEPKGWVCCGSSAAHRADPEAALRLPMENLALIEQSGFNEVTMPCAACFNRHKSRPVRDPPR